MKKIANKYLLIIVFGAILSILPNIYFTSSTVQASTLLEGISIKSPTNVYNEKSKSSTVLKDYKDGSILLYREHSKDWYITNVYLNGKRYSGYIHKDDVETSVQDQQLLSGIALEEPTSVYTEASTSSKKWKSYDSGSILLYRTYATNWYQARVFSQGKWRTGYIYKSHVENAIEDQELLIGVALNNPTIVYTEASTASSRWKEYSAGTILQYKTFSSNWYQATVYVKGKARTGYIHKNHVENALKEREQLSGIGLESPTTVYSEASTRAKALKSYKEGSILKYNTFSSSWYQTTVYVNGTAHTGYIHNNHVEGIYDNTKSLEGVAVKSKTNVYSRASSNSSVLKSYRRGNILYFKTFSPNWYKATVYLNGKAISGYIHIDDVNTSKLITNTTPYSVNYNRVVDIQMTKAPQVSGKNGGWVNASRSQVEYYVNPSNFNKNTESYYQFLDLSEPAGLNATEVNKKILYNHGSLTGKAEAFIEAGNKLNINEAYLISHALLETGNGKSTLASGVPVDSNGNRVPESQSIHTVFNMYGIGAYDRCPIECGAKEAFRQGWFTPESAIKGGAKFIGEDWIYEGQDTLYKMRWNPISPGYPQYATDVAWAVKQTKNISNIYKLLNNYVLIYDIPKYQNQPASSGDPDSYLTDGSSDNSNPELSEKYPDNVFGITNTSGNLNFRNGPSTNYDSIGSIPSGSQLEILGAHANGWYKVIYNGDTGWVSNRYVSVLNLLEVTATNLNVRETPNGTVKGTVSKELVAAVLENNSIVRNNEWYQIYYKGNKYWISGGANGSEYVKVR